MNSEVSRVKTLPGKTASPKTPPKKQANRTPSPSPSAPPNTDNPATARTNSVHSMRTARTPMLNEDGNQKANRTKRQKLPPTTRSMAGQLSTQETETHATQMSALTCGVDASTREQATTHSAFTRTAALRTEVPGHHTTMKTAIRGAFNYVHFVDAHYEHMQHNEGGVHGVEYTISDLMSLCDDAIHSFNRQSTLVDVNVPVNICGDVHGQFGDLIRMLTTIGTPPKQRYLFLGDYVDRGKQSLECVCLLLAYKVFYPHHVYLLRGNHEQARINKHFGFYDEIVGRFGKRQGKKLWKHFQQVFDSMPVVGLVEERIFCMHGGLSPALERMNDVRNFHKPMSDPKTGMMNDFMWADPSLDVSGWKDNERGTSFVFGEDVVTEFCRRFDLDMVVRAHQVCVDGYWFFANKKMVTVFSAPAYCNLMNNAGAAMHVSENMVCTFKIFQPFTPGYDKGLT